MGKDGEEPRESIKTDLKEFEGQMTIEMYRELVERGYEKIAALKLQLQSMTEIGITMRDKIAFGVYASAIEEASSLEDAAVDAYRAADALLRVRESGVAYESDVIGILKELRDSTKNDDAFGRGVRNFLKNS